MYLLHTKLCADLIKQLSLVLRIIPKSPRLDACVGVVIIEIYKVWCTYPLELVLALKAYAATF